jgi:hypothetical protein
MAVLIGRDREFEALEHHIDYVNERGAALLVRGAAGNGESATLTAARERGIRELYAIGVQSETHLPFAGLHRSCCGQSSTTSQICQNPSVTRSCRPVS